MGWNPFNIVKNVLGLGSVKQDFAGDAAAQGAENRETAILQSMYNNPNIFSPTGSQEWTMGPDGRPILKQTLSPAEQQKLEQSQRIESGGLGILERNLGNIDQALTGDFRLPGAAPTDYDPRYAPGGRVPTNLSFAGAPGMPRADAGVLQQVQDAMYGSGAQYLDPQYNQTEDATRSRLANQGINVGSKAYEQELENFRLGKQKAYGDLRMSSILGGQDAMQRLFDMGLAARQQGVGEATTQGQFAQQGIGQQAQIASNQAGVAQAGRQQNLNELLQAKTMPLNQINALLTSGQINAPNYAPVTPTSITPAPLFEAGKQEALLNTANQQRKSDFYGNVAKVISDRRLKTNIRRIGERYGLPWYEFEVLGEHREGVMADEAPAHVVVEGPLGFKMVDYGRLHADWQA